MRSHMAQHTPGPWSVGDWSALGEDISEVSLIRLDGGKLDVCYVAGQDDEAEANARHIVECVNEREPGGAVAALIEAASSTRDILAQFGPGEVWDEPLASLTAALAALEDMSESTNDADSRPRGRDRWTDNRYRLKSTGMIHSPGILRWLRNMYQFDPHRATLLIASTFPQLPLGTAIAYLTGSIEAELEDGGETAVLVQTNGYAAAEAAEAAEGEEYSSHYEETI